MSDHFAPTPRARLDRFKALADGVFSIALTLLIIDVVAAAKGITPGVTLAEHLRHHWQTGAAYLVGFLTIFVCWINQHVVLDDVEHADGRLLWTGGLQLGLVSAVPLPTALLAEYTAGADGHTAFAMYGITFLLIATSFWALSRAVTRSGLARGAESHMRLLKLQRAYRIAIGWNALCLLALRADLGVALPMWVLMFGVFAFPDRFAELVHRRSSSHLRTSAEIPPV